MWVNDTLQSRLYFYLLDLYSTQKVLLQELKFLAAKVNSANQFLSISLH